MRVPTLNMFQQQAFITNKQYEKINKLNVQLYSEQKLIQSSDDPVLASQINTATNALKNIESYKDSGVFAQNRVSLLESSAGKAIDTMRRVNELISRATSDTLSDEGRKNIASEMQGCLNSLLTVANTQDGYGQFVFSGFNTGTQPYIQQGNNYVYQGTYNPSSITISENINFIYTESGYDVFGNILNGNGNFTINASAANTGSGSTTAGNVTDPSKYIADTYTLTLVTNSSNKPAYQLVGANSGQVIPAPPATSPANAPDYVPGAPILFNGISFSLNGNPSTGDQFTIAPSTPNNIFDTLQSLITTLGTSNNNDPVINANFHQAMNQLGASCSQISNHLIAYQAELGTRASLINTQISTDEANHGNEEVIQHNLADINIFEIYPKFQQQLDGLEATQLVYKKIQEVMLKLLSP